LPNNRKPKQENVMRITSEMQAKTAPLPGLGLTALLIAISIPVAAAQIIFAPKLLKSGSAGDAENPASELPQQLH
jgi:hypothetical protein